MNSISLARKGSLCLIGQSISVLPSNLVQSYEHGVSLRDYKEKTHMQFIEQT